MQHEHPQEGHTREAQHDKGIDPTRSHHRAQPRQRENSERDRRRGQDESVMPGSRETVDPTEIPGRDPDVVAAMKALPQPAAHEEHRVEPEHGVEREEHHPCDQSGNRQSAH